MSRYLLLARNTPEGAERMLGGLRTGLQDFPRALERFGGKFVTAYAVTGRYDIAVIADFKDTAAILAYSLMASAQGQYVEALEVYGKAELGRAQRILRMAQRSYLSDMKRLTRQAERRQARGKKTSGTARKPR
jgi:uncharacterized protein with GYD domain